MRHNPQGLKYKEDVFYRSDRLSPPTVKKKAKPWSQAAMDNAAMYCALCEGVQPVHSLSSAKQEVTLACGHLRTNN